MLYIIYLNYSTVKNIILYCTVLTKIEAFICFQS